MRAELKDIVSSEVGSLDRFVPDDPTRFLIHVTLSIGLEGIEAADEFRGLICSTRSLAAMASDGQVLVGQPLLVAERWDFPLIRRRIQEYCASCEGADWEDILPMLTRLGIWEFERFQDREHELG